MLEASLVVAVCAHDAANPGGSASTVRRKRSAARCRAVPAVRAGHLSRTDCSGSSRRAGESTRGTPTRLVRRGTSLTRSTRRMRRPLPRLRQSTLHRAARARRLSSGGGKNGKTAIRVSPTCTATLARWSLPEDAGRSSSTPVSATQGTLVLLTQGLTPALLIPGILEPSTPAPLTHGTLELSTLGIRGRWTLVPLIRATPVRWTHELSTPAIPEPTRGRTRGCRRVRAFLLVLCACRPENCLITLPEYRLALSSAPKSVTRATRVRYPATPAKCPCRRPRIPMLRLTPVRPHHPTTSATSVGTCARIPLRSGLGGVRSRVGDKP